MELFQRIEHLIGKKLPLYKTEEEEVMMLMERVTEAQRYARMVRSSRSSFYENHVVVSPICLHKKGHCMVDVIIDEKVK